MAIWKPDKKQGRNVSPIDFDGSLRITRFRTGWSPTPYPPIIGCLSGFLPLQDSLAYAQKLARMPMGPNVTTVPVNLQNQAVIPALAKTG